MEKKNGLPYEFFLDDMEAIKRVCNEIDAAEAKLLERAKRIAKSKRTGNGANGLQENIYELDRKVGDLQNVVDDMKASLFIRYDA